MKTLTKKPKKGAKKSKPKKKRSKKEIRIRTQEPEPIVRQHRYRCEQCFNLTRESDLIELAREQRCPKCRKMFYVLAVEPGADEKVKKVLTRTAKENGLWHFFGKVIIPKEFAVRVSKDKFTAFDQDGKEIGIVRADHEEDALFKARNEFHYNKKRDRGDPNDPAIRERKARTIVRVELLDEGGNRTLRRYRAYSGYVIVQMEFNEETRTLIDKLKYEGGWGLLPMKPTLTGFRYPRKEPKQRTKPKRWELEQHEEWNPTPCSDEESAMILIRQAQVKEGPDKVEMKYKVGDRVRITDGTFEFQEGPVTDVYGPESEPRLKIAVKVLGVPLTADVRHDQVTQA